MSPRTKILQSIYLEPLQAEQLDELSAELKTPKAVLLREAVDDLLYRHGKVAHSPTFITLRRALKEARAQLAAYRKVIIELGQGIAPLEACNRAIDWVTEAQTRIKQK